MPKRKEQVADVSPATAKREKRMKRKRYNSDEYIMDDTAFLEAEEVVETTTSPAPAPPVVPVPVTPQTEHKKEKPTTPKSATIIKTTPTSKEVQKKKKITKPKEKDSGTSSEEERWLDAIESGKLEEVDDELKKIKPKDPKFMTARQRAMYEKNTEKEVANPISQHLMSLPTGYKEKVLTAEAIQKAQLKSAKRKQLADEKREKDKKKTMERLLKKQDSKSVKQIKNRPIKVKIPQMSYVQTVEGAKFLIPEGMEFPFQAQTAKEPPKPVLCGLPNCNNIKKYNCSKTNVPLCSFRCYKQNLEAMKKIIC